MYWTHTVVRPSFDWGRLDPGVAKEGGIMTSRWALLALLAIQLAAAAARATIPGYDAVGGPAAVSTICGDGIIGFNEQCDGTADSACPGRCNDDCACPPITTIDIPSSAAPPNTPGSPGVTVT